MINVCVFPTSLKLANITIMNKKGSKKSKTIKLQAGKYLAKYL